MTLRRSRFSRLSSLRSASTSALAAAAAAGASCAPADPLTAPDRASAVIEPTRKRRRGTTAREVPVILSKVVLSREIGERIARAVRGMTGRARRTQGYELGWETGRKRLRLDQPELGTVRQRVTGAGRIAVEVRLLDELATRDRPEDGTVKDVADRVEVHVAAGAAVVDGGGGRQGRHRR